MTVTKIPFLLTAAGLLLWGMGSVQTQNPSSPNIPGDETPQEQTSPTEQPSEVQTNPETPSAHHQEKKAEKLKTFSGKLVDAGCMVTAEKTNPEVQSPINRQEPSIPADVPQEPSAGPQTGPSSNPSNSPQAGPIPPSAQPGGPGKYPPTAGDEEAAPGGSEQASSLEKAAKACPATAATKEFGLVTGGGNFLKFDEQGNLKASQVMKSPSVQGAKTKKVKVVGKREGNTIEVAELQLKNHK
jgi:hypothetical protein